MSTAPFAIVMSSSAQPVVKCLQIAKTKHTLNRLHSDEVNPDY